MPSSMIPAGSFVKWLPFVDYWFEVRHNPSDGGLYQTEYVDGILAKVGNGEQVLAGWVLNHLMRMWRHVAHGRNVVCPDTE